MCANLGHFMISGFGSSLAIMTGIFAKISIDRNVKMSKKEADKITQLAWTNLR